MDHLEAVQLRAVERYILGELSPEVREQFEEHYFDCPECASDIRALARFRNASRLILEEEGTWGGTATERLKPGWLGWLRPAFAVPAIVILAAIVIFQATVTIPALKQRAGVQTSALIYGNSFHLLGTTRGGLPSRVAVAPNESFGLDFDFIPSQSFPRYQGSLVDSSGKVVMRFELNSGAANKEQHLVISGGMVQPGNYYVVFVGEPETANSGAKPGEVQRLSFAIAFGQ